MADNVYYTQPGTGTNIATDDVAGIHFQRIKIVDGTLDSTAGIPGDASNGLDVDVTRVQGSVTVVSATASSMKVDASGVAVPVTDNSGSLTVDAPVGTPVYVRLSDGSAALTTFSGALLTGFNSDSRTASGDTYTVKWSAINATASGDTTVVAAVTGKKIRVVNLMLTTSAAISIAWKSGANTLISGMAFAANGGINGERLFGYFMETNATEALIINLSAAANVRGSLSYIEV